MFFIDWLLKILIKTKKPGIVFFGHGVTEKIQDPFIESLHLPFDHFKNLISYYSKLGFEFVSMETVQKIISSRNNHHRPWLHLTFDDGYKNNFTTIYPYLKRQNIPFSIFISTHHIQTSERFYTYRIRCAIINTKKIITLPDYDLFLAPTASREERIAFYEKVSRTFKKLSKANGIKFIQEVDALLDETEWNYFNNLYQADEVISPEELQILGKDSHVHLGSHCHTHLILNQEITADEIQDEMALSLDWLLQNYQNSLLTFCYPNGKETDFSLTAKRICQETGYSLAFTTLQNPVTKGIDRFEIPRPGISENIQLARKQLIQLLLPDILKRFYCPFP